MTTQEIDRLHKYRKQKKFVNSIKEFQNITKISDSLLNKISLYFKFPSWVVKRNNRERKKRDNFILKNKQIVSSIEDSLNVIKKEIIKKINVNTATFKEILSIPNIDYDLCKKIVEYRNEVAELQNISELKNIDGFPINKYERIILYLEAK